MPLIQDFYAVIYGRTSFDYLLHFNTHVLMMNYLHFVSSGFCDDLLLTLIPTLPLQRPHAVYGASSVFCCCCLLSLLKALAAHIFGRNWLWFFPSTPQPGKMSLEQYEFYTVLSLDAKRSVDDLGYYDPLSHGYAGAYISLRVSRHAAVERAEQFFGAYINPASHAMLEITFTSLGAAYFLMRDTGPEYKYQSTLHRQTYSKHDKRNYEAWHFNEKLYLSQSDVAGNVLLTSKWVEMGTWSFMQQAIAASFQSSMSNMSEQQFVFYTVVSVDVKQHIVQVGYYDPAVFNGVGSYIGLRGTPEEAVERAQHNYEQQYDPLALSMLEITFTALGAAHYGMLCAGQSFAFQSALHRQTYGKDNKKNWNVWHFNGMLPLTKNGLISTKWLDVK